MPNGFSGVSVSNFFANTNNAISVATSVHNNTTFSGHSHANANIPSIPAGINQRPMFTPEDGLSGRHSVGVGNSSNVVVDQGTYDDVVRMVSATDDQSGEEIFKIATAIEAMCARVYIVPETVPRILEITSRIKGSLGRFRSVTEDVSIETRRFVNEIRNLDGADGMFSVAINERAMNDVIRNVSSVIDRQAGNMQNTSNQFSRTAQMAANQARSRLEQAARLEEQASGVRNQISDANNQINRILMG